MPPQQRRQIAKQVQIVDLITGRYVKEEGWEPNHLITNSGEEISRANVLGVVISKPVDDTGRGSSIVIDDKSGTIQTRSFSDEPSVANLEVGDVVIVVGRPREYAGQRYLLPEIVKKIADYRWVEVRLKALQLRELAQPRTTAPPAAVKKAAEPVVEDFDDGTEEDVYRTVYDLVKTHDAGDGAAIDTLIEKSPVKNTEKVLTALLEEGEIFEVRPGRVKVLE